eukprot:CAMPEP_0185271626 /NCGR_PEP_ID=MMETSP1359-20130426/45198_1 /TAXON_ID=552665 /ORGANISM="Bigelowiella longifila, Strain CCMP242" /LENGTH=99 /DNA_ID=CAMNT_0027863619 /DNA_START=413 /DNA_END=712 /DNA_ORIENTATION=-
MPDTALVMAKYVCSLRHVNPTSMHGVGDDDDPALLRREVSGRYMNVLRMLRRLDATNPYLVVMLVLLLPEGTSRGYSKQLRPVETELISRMCTRTHALD